MKPVAIKSMVISVLISILLLSNAFAKGVPDSNFTEFYQLLKTGSDQQALEKGEMIFARIETKYKTDAGFMAYNSKLSAACFLAEQMISELKKAARLSVNKLAGEIFEKAKTEKSKYSITPAKSFYKSSKDLFSKPVMIVSLQDQEKKFLASFYDLKLIILTCRIAKAGQSLAIADPEFKGTYDYVLVLGLLHLDADEKQIKIEIIPEWMRDSEQLLLFSDSCLTQFDFTYQARCFAKLAAELRGNDFSEFQFYYDTAKKCKSEFPNIAVDCMNRAMEFIDQSQQHNLVDLHLEIVNIWLDAENYALAAAQAKYIVDNYPQQSSYGQSAWNYFYALSRANNAESILANIDSFIADPRCADRKSKLMYTKWWALRRQRNQDAQIAALEHQMIKEFGSDPMIAPILLSQATDLTSQQDYAGAVAVLKHVMDNFSSTKAANQAKEMLNKLNAIK